MTELLEKFDGIKERGWIDSLRTGDTGIGYTFETLLGIKENNDQQADFKGIEIKCKGTKVAGMRKLNRPEARAPAESTVIHVHPWLNPAHHPYRFRLKNTENHGLSLQVADFLKLPRVRQPKRRPVLVQNCRKSAVYTVFQRFCSLLKSFSSLME